MDGRQIVRAPPVRRRRGRGEAAPGSIPPKPGGAAVGIDTRGGHDDRDRGHGVAVIRPCVKRPSHPPLVGQAVLQLPTGRGERGTPGEFGIRRKNAVFSAEAKRGQNAKIRPAFPLNETRCPSIVFGRQSSDGKTQSFRRMTVSRRVHDYYSTVRFWGRVEQVGS